MSKSADSGSIRVVSLCVGPLQCGCYVVWADGSAEAVVIDPGGEADEIRTVLAREGLSLSWIVNTHGHGDHIGANADLKRDRPEARLAIHPLDAPMLTSPFKNLSLVFGVSIRSPEADVLLEEGDVVETDALRLEVLHTPGHTPGSISLLARGRPMHLFTGDLLMAGGVGRTDFMGGSFAQLKASIHDKVLTLPDDTIVHPGHPPDTTVGRERTGNPYLD
jgi:glyoxylase-like metal-dependent hydrolase (beta-lactamase superfamily II)